MEPKKIFIGILFIGLGAIFFFNNEDMGKGMAKFYQKFYSEKNTIVMLKAAGVILILGGLALMLIK
ncbi:hypothetical protein ACFL23_01185 [Patescibacteria group bacterium]